MKIIVTGKSQFRGKIFTAKWRPFGFITVEGSLLFFASEVEILLPKNSNN